ncbi:MAG: cation:proton antiporter [Verrucomicrobia bacterium]|nr:cation:proton antiporter [Verrucomicrobiota bacterium]
MHGVTFLQDLAVVMIVAALVTVLFHRLKQPVVLGYIIAGVIIGPHTPPFPLIKDEDAIKTLAELGVVFLMFSLGLEFSLRKLRKVGGTALIAAALEIVLMVGVGYHIGRAFGWKTMDCIFLGAMISISSTTIIVKTLGELGRSKETFAELILGILIVQDVLAIVMIALLSSIAMTGSLAVGEVLSTMTRLGVFLTVALVLGLLAVPRLLNYVARFKSNEVLLVAVLGLCFGVALLAVKLNYSVALGAFIIGAVIAEAREIGRVEVLTEPIRDMFCAVFFVAIGLLIEPALLVKYAWPIGLITLAVIVGQALSCSFGVFVAGHDTRTALQVGMGLAQIGEFSFIIASLGLTLGVTSDFLYPIVVTVSAVTTFTTPYLIKSSDRMVSWFDRVAPAKFVNYLALYTRWVGQWSQSQHRSMAGRLVRKWAWQMSLNVAMVAGIFIALGFVGRRLPAWLPGFPGGVQSLAALVWLGAMLLSLPMLIATYRKMEALGILLGEMAATRLGSEPRASAIQAIVANTVLAAGVIGVGLLMLLLSSTILPTGRVLILLLLIVAGITALLWRTFIRLYSRAQVTLEETFAQPPPPRHAEPPHPLAGLLKEAVVETITVTPDCRSAGRLIRELELRTQTGASIVGIERNGATLINPGPDEELQAGDQVLLLGNRQQLDDARKYLLDLGSEL